MTKELGLQPLDGILDEHSLKNDDLVKASEEQLSHKQVQKARKGRRITPNIKGKVLRALNNTIKDKDFNLKQLFNYR